MNKESIVEKHQRGEPALLSELLRAAAERGIRYREGLDERRVIAEIQSDGTCWCGGTVWQGQTAMRISVSSWATTDEDVERSLAAMLRIAAR
jgi:hypothetical protein